LQTVVTVNLNVTCPVTFKLTVTTVCYLVVILKVTFIVTLIYVYTGRSGGPLK